MNNKEYNQRQYRRKRQVYRFTLGVQQFFNYPVLNTIWILVGIAIKYFIIVERNIVLNLQVAPLLQDVFKWCIKIIEVVFPIICLIGFIQLIGEITAVKDEALIYKVFANNGDYKNDPPILIRKKVKNGVTTREFYTTISMKEWENKIDDICDKLDIHLIGEIVYGGKNENTGYLRKITSAKGRKTIDRGVIYDDII